MPGHVTRLANKVAVNWYCFHSVLQLKNRNYVKCIAIIYLQNA
jgi:hypothetical protein